MLTKGDKVKVVKWRDGGHTAEVLYFGRVVDPGDSCDPSVKVKVIKGRAGFKPGNIEAEDPADVLEYVNRKERGGEEDR